MEDRGGYGQFCPVSMAAEILCTRWTTLVIRELLCGSTRFNDLQARRAAHVAGAPVQALESNWRKPASS